VDARELSRRFLRGFLLFAVGALAGSGAVMYFGMRHNAAVRTQTAAPVVTAPVAPAPAFASAPPTPSPAATLPDVPAGQFDSARKPVDAVETPVIDASKLLIPVQGIRAAQLVDTFTQARSNGRVHDAIDIMAPAGTPVLAATDGSVAKLFASNLGGTTLYEFDASGTVAYYYAHLQAYAPGVVEGKPLKQGEVIGYVGSTGNASPSAPHLHFAIFVLGPEKRWWQGTAINPYPLLSGAAAR